jgi:hypothetical protein
MLIVVGVDDSDNGLARNARGRCGRVEALLAYLRSLRAQHVDAKFTVGWAVGAREHAAIAALPETAWTDATVTLVKVPA